MFQHIPPYAGDPILSLMEQFNADTRSEKVNLSIGLYYNEDSIVPQLETIIEAQKRIEPKNGKTKLYLPMEGFKPYREAIQALLFGANSPAVKAGRAVTIQTLGTTMLRFSMALASKLISTHISMQKRVV